MHVKRLRRSKRAAADMTQRRVGRDAWMRYRDIIARNERGGDRSDDKRIDWPQSRAGRRADVLEPHSSRWA